MTEEEELREKDLNAGVTQWLESLPSKQVVVGSSPIARSYSKRLELRIRGEIGRRARLRSVFLRKCGFKSHRMHS